MLTLVVLFAILAKKVLQLQRTYIKIISDVILYHFVRYLLETHVDKNTTSQLCSVLNLNMVSEVTKLLLDPHDKTKHQVSLAACYWSLLPVKDAYFPPFCGREQSAIRNPTHLRGTKQNTNYRIEWTCHCDAAADEWILVGSWKRIKNSEPRPTKSNKQKNKSATAYSFMWVTL